MSLRISSLTALLLVSSISGWALAHNGYISTAEPVSDITIDGKLDDWPDRMRSHPISAVIQVCDASESDRGFQGRYRVGFNVREDAIYVAVEVVDDRIELEGFGGEEWNTRDACELFFAVDHADAKAPPVQFVYRDKPYATYKDAINKEFAKAARVARASKDGEIVYEWRIDLELLRGKDEEKPDLREGAVIGFDVAYIDRDTVDAYTFFCSSEGTWKHVRAHELGDLVLSLKGTEIVQLAGRTGWRNANIGRPQAIRFTSADNEAISLQVPVTKHGQFMASLPQGEYEAAAVANYDNVSKEMRRVVLRKDTILSRALLFDFVRTPSSDQFAQDGEDADFNDQASRFGN